MNPFKKYIQTSHDWIEHLEMLNPSIAHMNLKAGMENSKYVRRKKDKIELPANTYTYKLANSAEHNALVVRTIEQLLINQKDKDSDIKTLLRNLLGRETYGAFCQLAAYDWLLRLNTSFSIEVALANTDVLGIHGSTLDGQLRLHAGNAYFDVKAFGFNERVIMALKNKLENELPETTVKIEHSWDIQIESIQSLLDPRRFKSLLQELKVKKRVKIERLMISLEEKIPISISWHTLDPYLLAETNAKYSYKFAKQFTCNAPFLLFYVIDPWLDGVMFHHNSFSLTNIFTRALARRTFMQFSHDNTEINGTSSVTFSEAAPLLSGIVFLDVWPKEEKTADNSVNSWIYLNPRAKHCLRIFNFSIIKNVAQNNIVVEDFMHDDY